MAQGIVVLDVGKTRAKLSLWSSGRLIMQLDRANARPVIDGVPQLDVADVQEWLLASLAELARHAKIEAIVPVGHGAAAALTVRDKVVAALDYETPVPADVAALYEAERDDFAATLSPRLEGGLNLGAQLFWMERLYPDLWPRRGHALLWPQYWAFFLCGERASEVTSLGCHTDLWRPIEGRFSDVALRRGWAERLGPVRAAGDVLGPLKREVASATGLPRNCLVYCGLHDSNAALHAARGAVELSGGPFCVVSTGTWIICLRAGGGRPVRYDPHEDMLANVDVAGQPTPTARFMGGRNYEGWMGGAIGARSQLRLIGEAAGLAEWTDAPPHLRATRAAIELARRTHQALTLIAGEGPIVVEGRFANDLAFGATLAALRRDQPVYRSSWADGVAMGALRLVLSDAPGLQLAPIEPASSDVGHTL